MMAQKKSACKHVGDYLLFALANERTLSVCLITHISVFCFVLLLRFGLRIGHLDFFTFLTRSISLSLSFGAYILSDHLLFNSSFLAYAHLIANQKKKDMLSKLSHRRILRFFQHTRKTHTRQKTKTVILMLSF